MDPVQAGMGRSESGLASWLGGDVLRWIAVLTCR